MKRRCFLFFHTFRGQQHKVSPSAPNMWPLVKVLLNMSWHWELEQEKTAKVHRKLKRRDQACCKTQQGIPRELPHLLLKENLSDQAPPLQSLAMPVSSYQALQTHALVGPLNLYIDLTMAFTKNLKETSKQSYKDAREKLTRVQCQTPHTYGAT